MPCSYCGECGHNIRTCEVLYRKRKKSRFELQKKQERYEEEKTREGLRKKTCKSLNKQLEEENEALWELVDDMGKASNDMEKAANQLLKRVQQRRKTVDKQDKLIRRLRKKITEKNKNSTRELAYLGCKVAELTEALKKSSKVVCNETEELTCSICYDIIDKSKNFTKTECGHCFHTKCLMIWVGRQQKNSCPYCRRAVY